MATRRGNKTLQAKLDRMLAKAIADVRSLGYEPSGDIEPHVRITGNSRSIGTCTEVTKSLYRVRRGVYDVIPGRRPRFRISCSRNAGNSDAEVMDVIYHEVIHTLPGCFSHGREFKQAAERVNEAFGAHVQTTKQKATDSAGRMLVGSMRLTHDEAKAEVEKLVGRTFDSPKRSMRLVGINPRAPKRCCSLVDVNTGDQLACAPELLLILMQEGHMH